MGDEILLETTQIKQRLPFIDLIRGITIIEMISYHFLWDLVYLYIQLSDNLLNVTWLKSVLAYIGFPQAGFSSTDYFPLLPWIFLFATGYFLYSFLQEKGLINRLFGKWKVPGINFLGKHSLIIYMIHQPICYVVAFLVSEIF